MCIYIYIYIYIYTHIYDIYIYIYIYSVISLSLPLSLSLYIYIYVYLSISLSLSIYIYIYIRGTPSRDLVERSERRPRAGGVQSPAMCKALAFIPFAPNNETCTKSRRAKCLSSVTKAFLTLTEFLLRREEPYLDHGRVWLLTGNFAQHEGRRARSARSVSERRSCRDPALASVAPACVDCTEVIPDSAPRPLPRAVNGVFLNWETSISSAQSGCGQSAD